MWTAATIRCGYGEFGVDGKVVYAHRWAYEYFVGPIPDGLDIDHVCHNDSGCELGFDCPHRRCVNPNHLEAVPHHVNLARGNGNTGAINAAKTHCPQGHPYSGENLYVDPRGSRQCRACKREANRRYYRARTC